MSDFKFSPADLYLRDPNRAKQAQTILGSEVFRELVASIWSEWTYTMAEDEQGSVKIAGARAFLNKMLTFRLKPEIKPQDDGLLPEPDPYARTFRDPDPSTPGPAPRPRKK